MGHTDVIEVNGSGLFEVDTDNAEDAFDAAIASLGSLGGVLKCYPGSTQWRFSGACTIPVANPNVKIIGNGVELGFNGASSLYMFRVQSSGVTFRDVRFKDTAAASLGTSTRRIISVEDAGTNNASGDFRLIDCDFDVMLATQEIRDYQCLSVVGNSEGAASMRRGLYVRGCSFYARLNSIPETRYATGTTPNGIHFIKTVRSGSQFISGNNFRGEFASNTLENVPSGGAGQLEQLQINATVASGNKQVVFKSVATDPTLTGTLQPGSTFTIGANPQEYKVVKQSTAGTNLITVTFYPALVAEATINAAVALTAVGANAHVASAVTMIDHNQSIVEGNAFINLQTQAAAAGQGGPLLHSISLDGESGHSTFTGNEFEELNCWWIIRAEGGASFSNRWVNVRNNDFGRILPYCEAIVSMDKCGASRVIGNGFHNVGGGSHGGTDTNGYPIYLANGCSTVIVDHNSHEIASLDEARLVYTDGTCKNLRIGEHNVPEWDL